MSVLPSLAKASVAPSAASTWRTRTRSARTRPSRTPTRTGCPSTSSRCCSIPRSLASSRSIGSTLPTPTRSSRDASACTWSARPPAPERATTRHPPGESTGTKNLGCPALGSIHQEVVPVLARAGRHTPDVSLSSGPGQRSVAASFQLCGPRRGAETCLFTRSPRGRPDPTVGPRQTGPGVLRAKVARHGLVRRRCVRASSSCACSSVHVARASSRDSRGASFVSADRTFLIRSPPTRDRNLG